MFRPNCAFSLLLPLLLLCSFAARSSGTSFYHSISELFGNITAIAQDCGPLMRVEWTDYVTVPPSQTDGAYNGSIPVVTFQRPPSKGAPKRRVLIFFAEHAREVVSSELALQLILDLCGNRDDDASLKALKDDALSSTDFKLVPMSNPTGRYIVEHGEWCQRTNENGVDLNRNWDSHWASNDPTSETYSGSEALSEPETRALKRIMEDWSAETFLSMHSGSGPFVLTPFAYTEGIPRSGPGIDTMEAIADTIAEQYCNNCEHGSAGSDLHYLSPGTSLDYALLRPGGATFSFAIEMGVRWHTPVWESESTSLLTAKSSETKRILHRRKAQIRREQSSCFNTVGIGTLGRKNEIWSDSATGCEGIFNPITRKQLNRTVATWSEAIMQISRLANLVMDSNGDVKNAFSRKRLDKMLMASPGRRILPDGYHQFLQIGATESKGTHLN